MPDSSVSVVFNLWVGVFPLGQGIFSPLFQILLLDYVVQSSSQSVGASDFLSGSKGAWGMQLNAYFIFMPKLILSEFIIRRFSNTPGKF